jgi:hypothetical protein
MDQFSKHLMNLKGVSPSDIQKAKVSFPDGSHIIITVTAEECFRAWTGYWSNFRLADVAFKKYPTARGVSFVTGGQA